MTRLCRFAVVIVHIISYKNTNVHFGLPKIVPFVIFSEGKTRIIIIMIMTLLDNTITRKLSSSHCVP